MPPRRSARGVSEDPSEVADAGADLEESEAGSTAGSEYAGSDVVLEGVGVAAAEVSDGDGSEVGLWCEWSLVRSMLVDHVHKKRGGKPEVYLEGQISNDEPDDWLSKPAAAATAAASETGTGTWCTTRCAHLY